MVIMDLITTKSKAIKVKYDRVWGRNDQCLEIMTNFNIKLT